MLINVIFVTGIGNNLREKISKIKNILKQNKNGQGLLFIIINIIKYLDDVISFNSV